MGLACWRTMVAESLLLLFKGEFERQSEALATLVCLHFLDLPAKSPHRERPPSQSWLYVPRIALWKDQNMVDSMQA